MLICLANKYNPIKGGSECYIYDTDNSSTEIVPREGILACLGHGLDVKRVSRSRTGALQLYCLDIPMGAEDIKVVVHNEKNIVTWAIVYHEFDVIYGEFGYYDVERRQTGTVELRSVWEEAYFSDLALHLRKSMGSYIVAVGYMDSRLRNKRSKTLYGNTGILYGIKKDVDNKLVVTCTLDPVQQAF